MRTRIPMLMGVLTAAVASLGAGVPLTQAPRPTRHMARTGQHLKPRAGSVPGGLRRRQQRAAAS